MKFIDGVKLSYSLLYENHFKKWYFDKVLPDYMTYVKTAILKENSDTINYMFDKLYNTPDAQLRLFELYDFSLQFGVFIRYIVEHTSKDEYAEFMKDFSNAHPQNYPQVIHMHLFSIWQKYG